MMMIHRRMLSATCRLQLHEEFGFADVARIAGYLRALGISHVYASPMLQARPGSRHGYDVADPTCANPELGGDEQFARMVETLHEHDLGLILDIVPNHMGTGPANPYWEDMLTHGEASRWARWFDVEWSAGRGGSPRVHLAVLGDELDAVLERGELGLAWSRSGMRVTYFDNQFPTDPATLARVLRSAGEKQPDGEDRNALEEILRGLESLPERAANAGGARGARRKAADELLRRLQEIAERSPAMREHIERTLAAFSTGEGGSDRMRDLLEAQPYRLAFWRTAPRDLNYRRFFDINELVALRVEDAEVFSETHERILEWIADESLDGIRIDHIDGLLHPREYLDRLRQAIRSRGREPDHDPFPIFVEKILSPGEHLRTSWPVQGTTGYEFLNDLEAIFIDPVGHAAITRFYARLSGLPAFADVAYEGKLRILRTSLSTDVTRLSRLLWPLAAAGRRTSGLGKGELRAALIEMIARLPVYRTYADPATGAMEPEDRAILERATRRAIEGRAVPIEAIELVRQIFVGLGEQLPGGRADGGIDAAGLREAALRFVARFQQTSGPATAKGVEDTALYQHNPLASLNEVGGEPERPLERAVEMLHEANALRARHWPKHLLCTNTHDTKRSADVRARIDVLSEMPDRWEQTVLRWRQQSRAFRTRVREHMAPDANTQYLLYQTLVGVWPFPAEGDRARGEEQMAELERRVTEYMQKATREAKTHTSWTDPDEAWEAALERYIDCLFERPDFIAELEGLVREVALPAISNSLSRTLVHLTSPGTPDLYQGDELWSFALVDPDNRRPVDFDARMRLIQELQRGRGEDATSVELARELVRTPEDGRIKLHVVMRTLQSRRQRARVFQGGEYQPLRAEGARERHAFAFARTNGREASITLATRLPYGMAGASALPFADRWEDTRLILPPGLDSPQWRCALSGITVESAENGGTRWLHVGSALSVLPVALLSPA